MQDPPHFAAPSRQETQGFAPYPVSSSSAAAAAPYHTDQTAGVRF